VFLTPIGGGKRRGGHSKEEIRGTQEGGVKMRAGGRGLGRGKSL